MNRVKINRVSEVSEKFSKGAGRVGGGDGWIWINLLNNFFLNSRLLLPML